MDVLGIAASIIAVVQLTGTCLKLCNQFLGRSQHNIAGLKDISFTLYSFHGAIKNLQTHLEINEEDQTRLDTLNHLDRPLANCKEALDLLKTRLETTTFLGQYIVGTVFDKRLKSVLETLKTSKSVFELTLHADQQVIVTAVEHYIRNVAEDVRDVRAAIEEHGRHLLKLNKNTRDQHMEQIEEIRQVGINNLEHKRDLETRIENGYRDQTRQEIVAWFSPLNFFTTQTAIFDRWQQGTGRWFLDSSEFKSWVSGSGETLWCPGIPGAGKTILASLTMHQLREEFGTPSNVGIACIYCNFVEQDVQTPVNLLASIWRQLAYNRDSLSTDIEELYKIHRRQGTKPTLEEVTMILWSEIVRYSKVFVVIDALDECSEKNQSREILLTSLRTLGPKLNIMATSRFLENIRIEFQPMAQLEISASNNDVEKFVTERISRDARLSKFVKKDMALRKAIIEAVVENAQKMFLLARLHMDSLAMQVTRKATWKTLTSLPKQLDEFYDQALQRIGRQNIEMTKLTERVLLWISNVFRPLTLSELQHALAVEVGEFEFDDENVPDEELMISSCAGLVIVDNPSNTIRFVHHTAREYFQRKRMELFPDARKEIATTCLSYLLLHKFAGDPNFSDKQVENSFQENPFLSYAAQYWGNHVRGDLEQDPEIRALITRFLCTPAFLRSVKGTNPKHIYECHVPRFSKAITGLQIAAFFGLEVITTVILNNGADIMARDPYGWTALHHAARGGHETVVRLLLRNGADSAARDSYGETPLNRAAAIGHQAVVQLLLECRVDTGIIDVDGHTALTRAAYAGHEIVVRLLLENGASVTHKDAWGKTALHRAAFNGHEGVARLLLAQGADVTAKCNNGWTVLFHAAHNGHEGLVRLLLIHNRNVMQRTSTGEAPLHVAAVQGHSIVVRLLVENGAAVDAKNDNGQTALHKAAIATSDHRETMHFLLENQAAVDEKDGNGQTALQLAAANGKEATVRLLLDYGANNAKANIDDLLLIARYHDAAAKGYEATVRLMLEEGMAVDVKGPYEKTALHRAANSQHEGVARLLLDKGASVNTRDFSGSTALHLAAHGNLTVVTLLLKRDADINAKNQLGRTALHHAAWAGNDDIVRLLLQNGADVAEADNGGYKALDIAKMWLHEDVVRLLTQV